MRTILTDFAARSLTRELADRDAHQLRDIGLVRAADGTVRLLDDPSVLAVPPDRRVKQGLSWRRFWAGMRRSSGGLKTVP
jgi:hypothetical protein